MNAKLKQNLKISSTFTAALVGAGFASGQEIALFFGGKSIISLILAAGLIAFFCYIFLELGRITKGDIFSGLSNNFSLCFTYLIKLINLILLAVMVAGSEYILASSLGIRGGGMLSLLLACILVFRGMENIKLLNTLVVPIMIILIFAILLRAGGKVYIKGKIDIPNALAYAGMNIISGGYLISLMAKDIYKEQCYKISFFCFVQILIMLTLVYAAVNLAQAEIMPILVQAYKHNLGLIGVAAIFLALFTSMVSALASCSLSKTRQPLIYAGLGFLISLFGFHNLVNTTYIPIGAVGFAVTVCCLFYLATLSVRNRYQASKSLHF